MLRARPVEGSVVVIVGASSGVGRASAHAFARRHARLVLASRNADALDAVAEECAHLGGKAIIVTMDVRDADAAELVRRAAVDAYGSIDTWVNLAAVLLAGEFGSESVDEIESLVQTNIVGAVFSARAALEQFREQEHGVLIDVSSMLGAVPNPLVPLYVMSKFAVRGLSLALHHASRAWPGVHVCVVMPGPLDTPMFDRAANHTRRRLRAIPPAISPERVAAAIVGCARRPRTQRPVGVTSRLILIGLRVVPRFTEWSVATYSGTFLITSDEAEDTAGAVMDPVAIERVQGHFRHGAMRRRLGDSYGRWAASRGA
jgi:short-subunit dehydrogenase